MSAGAALPSVEVVIPTHNRPELLRRAIDSVLAQTYSGRLTVTVVFDRQQPDEGLATVQPIAVRVLANNRAPGLAGTRNTAIVASDADLIAFLDDDDRWHPDKLTRQVARMVSVPAAVLCTTAVQIDYDAIMSTRLAHRSNVSHAELLASRMAMLHSSTFLISRAALQGELGLVDELAPGGQNEDWDLLLRASAIRPIVHLDEPLVTIQWGSSSMFAGAWHSRIAGAEWILAQHPDIRDSQVGYARLMGQIAFGQAATGQRKQALRTALRSAQVRWREPRGYLAAAVAAGVPSGFVQRTLHRRGHGI